MTPPTSAPRAPDTYPSGQPQQAPWSVKGIAPHTRDAVKEAARRSGMTIGEWLSAAITRQAQAEPFPPRAAAPDERWAEVATHLARLVRRNAEAQPAAPREDVLARETSVHVIELQLREAEARAVRRERERAAHLAEALTGLARYIDNAEKTRTEEARRAALEQAEATRALSHTLARIARQVKRIDDQLAAPPHASPGDAAAVQAELLAGHLLPAMEARLAAALADVVDRLPQATASTADTDQLAVEDRLARAIVDIRARQVELARLESSDEEAAQRAIIERLEVLSRKLDSALLPREDEASSPILGRIEELVRHLCESVEALHNQTAHAETAQAGAGDTALDTLAAQIAQVVGRLEDLSRRGELGGGDTAVENRLETAIGALSLQLRDLPKADDDTLERMARAAAREALGVLSPDDALPRQRSDDALDAVHSTLERIVDRLALIEEDIRAGGTGLRQTGDASRDGNAVPQGALSLPEVRAAQALSRVFTSPGAEPAESVAEEPENLLARDQAGLTENIGFTASFIAAARRAAMAAADETREKPAGAPAPQSDAETVTDPAGRRRSLLIGVGALIAATGAAQVAATLMNGAARVS